MNKSYVFYMIYVLYSVTANLYHILMIYISYSLQEYVIIA